MVVIKRSKGPTPGETGRPKIRRVHLVTAVTAQTQQQLKKKAAKETEVFEKRITLAEAITLAGDAGIAEADVRAAVKDGEIVNSLAANGIRYQISPASLTQWIADHTP